MKGLTPDEFWALERLLLPVGSRAVVVGSTEDELRVALVEQGRAMLTMYAEPRRSSNGYGTNGAYELTPAGREALRLWPAVREALGAA